MAIELSNPKVYSDFINSYPTAVVHFWGAWNAYDRIMQKTLKEVEPVYDGRVGFGSVDVDREEMMQICIDVGMKNVPALAYYKHGIRIETIIGLESKEKIEERLNIILGTGNDTRETSHS